MAAVLRYVDLENPAHSPLLTLSSGNHGLAGRAVFDGHGGDEQLRILRGWLADAARDRLRGIDRSREPGFESDNFEPESLILIRGRTAPDVQPADPANADKDLLNAILHDEQRDEFDPEEFNRLVHGHEQER